MAEEPVDPEKLEEDAVGRGGTFDDIRLAFQRNTTWVQYPIDFVQGLFHYFFVGCASLLGLLIVLLIPTVVAVAVAVLLGIPGYIVYHWRWLVAEGQYFSPWIVLITIFWSGYFVTHGWPHLWPALVGVFGWFKPALVWMGRVLENISDDDEDEPTPTKPIPTAAVVPTTDAETTGEEVADDEDAESEETDEEDSEEEAEPTTKRTTRKKKVARKSTKATKK